MKILVFDMILCRLSRNGNCLEIVLFPYGTEAGDNLLNVADDVASPRDR